MTNLTGGKNPKDNMRDGNTWPKIGNREKKQVDNIKPFVKLYLKMDGNKKVSP